MKDISMSHQNEFHSMQLLGCLVVLSFFNWASHSLPHRCFRRGLHGKRSTTISKPQPSKVPKKYGWSKDGWQVNWISKTYIYIYLERLLHILHRERSLLVFEEFPIVSCGISVLRWNSLCIIRRFVLLGLMTGNLDCILNPSLFDDSLICRDKCCRNDEESEDHGHLSILLCFIVLKVVKWCQVHLGLLLTDWRLVLQNDIVNYMLARMLDSLKSL